MSASAAIVCWLLASGAEVCTEPVPAHEAYGLRAEEPDGARRGTIYQDDTWKYEDVTGKPRSGPELDVGDDDTPAWRNLR